MIGKLKVSCLLSFAVCIAGVAALAVLRRRFAESSADAAYDGVFGENTEEQKDGTEEQNEQDN